MPADKLVPGQAFNSMKTYGVDGFKQYSGYVYEDFLPELQGMKGRRMFREMRDNEPIAKASLTAYKLSIKSAGWMYQSHPNDKANFGGEFLEQCMGDMEHSFGEAISNALCEMEFGFSLLEKVYKRRLGPDQRDPSKYSAYTDGMVGIRKLPIRAPETIEQWLIDDVTQEVTGFYQNPEHMPSSIFIPIEKCIHFKTTEDKGNPEGKSLLRSAYMPYFFKKNIQTVEAIGIERNLAGVPVIRIPQEYWNTTDPNKSAVLNAYKKIARDVYRNEQNGFIIPSDVWLDQEGSPTSMPKFSIELLSVQNTGTGLQTDAIIRRHEQNIAVSCLTDFLLLGMGKSGSFALADTKLEMFMMAVQAFLNDIADTLNRQLVPELWKLNGFDMSLMPKFAPEKMDKTSIEKLGQYLSDLAGAGIPIIDLPTINYLRNKAGLPDAPEDEVML